MDIKDSCAPCHHQSPYHSAFRKLGVKHRTQAVIALQQMGIKDD
ncbi:hypothetical protein [Aeromonas sp. PrichA-15]|nr:hypothetical protein [Aeromonas sp. PrichA-15]